MIALTQEKREELANYARARLASHVVYGGCSDEEDIFKIALASLTAETFLYAVDSDVEDKIYTVLCSEHEVGSYPLYTAPPVPEIKLPDDNSCEDGLKKHGLRTKSEGISQLSDGFRCGFSWYENEIKRLNGLGE
ncbi:hypothetical protein [Rosenbergiella metrosideri]|uniref:hypothetical protein n=1 Tax=Rosenbergiella metrosideri TaxID=2921185 RepID=UPI001F4F6396|nr:hypothetical protein [Rosenbergiella metrosideri]